MQWYCINCGLYYEWYLQLVFNYIYASSPESHRLEQLVRTGFNPLIIKQ
jgi:hypothetical protein